jgi:8-oxo-dGTP pyrophosphatase MutT (NUDIX family)
MSEGIQIPPSTIHYDLPAAIKVGAITLMPYKGGFLGMQCKKGRGLILPGGTYEPKKDATYKDTAIREAQEEVGVTPKNLRYLWCGPDGGGYMTFAFEAQSFEGEPKASNEGVPQVVHWSDLFESTFGAYYEILYEVMQQKGIYE